VMDQAGHTSPSMTLGIYARVMRRSEGEKGRLRALVDGGSLMAVSARLGAEKAPDESSSGAAAIADLAEVAR
jgi:hypothetical protein